ncbi:YhbY family RNA-binding protein [Sulfuricystis multivorans]|uniref:YhbY family RNA-binding protein n=1 Tax=Sulfuricystis multivorans TaxID=2211108 RepID=UPI000F840355|nr:YhbY family RNA-binding protein [Sulfuricystis multivorans]
MIELSPTERRALRAAAHHLQPTVAIAGNGLTPNVVKEIDVSLKAHALIKVKLHGIERDDRAALLEEICVTLDCAPVQHIGNILVLWRPKPAEEAVQKPRRHKPTAPKTKKQAAAALEKQRR